jgi:hypothetical protein
MAFIYAGTRDGQGRRMEKAKMLPSSTAVAVGSVYALYASTDDRLAVAVKDLPILGILTAIVDKYGNPFKPAIAAGTATGSTVISVTTGATNTTYWGIIDSSQFTKWSAAVNGTLGTTAASDYKGGWDNIDSDNTNYSRVLESLHSRTATSLANFRSYGKDPQNATRLIEVIHNSEYNAYGT